MSTTSDPAGGDLALAQTVRWRLDIRYDGAAFSGWASQPGRRTVQGELELWLARVLSLAAPPRLVCAGRTDAGVHARGQVAHLDLPSDAPDGAALRHRLGRALPPDVTISAITPSPRRLRCQVRRDLAALLLPDR